LTIGTTQGQEQSAQIQRLQAQHEHDLFSVGSPGLRLALGDFIKDLGQPGQEPESVKKAFGEARGLQDQQFEQQAGSIPLTAAQQAKQSGFRGSAGTIDRSSSEALYQLEGQRRQAQNQLQMQEVDASLQQRDFDLSQILGLSEGSIASSFGFSRNQLAAAGLDNRNAFGGALSGAVSGASLGTSISPGWGTLIGGVAGGAVGYFGNT
jgi:hypothetical protein